MLNKSIFIRCIYSWRTLILTILLFIVTYYLTCLFITPMGGCAGCVPDLNGGLMCSNHCSYPHPMIFVIGSYLASYIFSVIYYNKQNRQTELLWISLKLSTQPAILLRWRNLTGFPWLKNQINSLFYSSFKELPCQNIYFLTSTK